jgi:hypothetical protein
VLPEGESMARCADCWVITPKPDPQYVPGSFLCTPLRPLSAQKPTTQTRFTVLTPLESSNSTDAFSSTLAFVAAPRDKKSYLVLRRSAHSSTLGTNNDVDIAVQNLKQRQ